MRTIFLTLTIISATFLMASTDAKAAYSCCPQNGHQVCGNPPNHCDDDRIIQSQEERLLSPQGVIGQIPSRNFQCVSNQPGVSLNSQGEFREIPIRHGEGHINFSGQATASGQTISINRSGRGRTWSIDEIEYSDSQQASSPAGMFIETRIMDQNYYNQNHSVLKVNGRIVGMACRFTPLNSNLQCPGHYYPCGGGCCRTPNM